MTELLQPGTEAELAARLGDLARSRRPVRIRGGGTRSAVGAPVEAELVLSTAGLSGITLYEPAALTIGARAGTPVAEIEAVLAAEGQHLAFEPADWRRLLDSTGDPTIGGAMAAGIAGPRRIQAGALRDSAVGVRFVDGSGTIVKNGGRVMKNVTGYDLVKLLAGSWGTLGVVTELFFKVLPRPQRTATLVYQGLGDADAVALLARALGSPFDVTGAAHQTGASPTTLVRLEGFDRSVRYRSEALAALLEAGRPAAIIEGEASAQIWRQIRDVEPFADRAGTVWRISVRPLDAPAIVALIRDRCDVEVLYDWGGGLVWALTQRAADGGAAILREAVASKGGHATLIRGSHALRSQVASFQPEAPALAALAHSLRSRFDPAGILNPGLLSARPAPATAATGS